MFSSAQRKQFAVMASMCLFGASGFLGERADAAGPGAKIAGWKVQPDPPKSRVEWPESLKLNITQPERQEEILFPSAESEFCVVGLDAYESNKAELWNMTTGKRVGAMNGNPQKATKRAVSQDGKYLACAVLDRSLANDVEVWSLETGKKVCSFTADDRKLPMTILDFAEPDEVVTFTFGKVGETWNYHLRVWDAATGKPLRQMDVGTNLNNGDKYDISPGRNLLACIIIPEVKIFDLQTGQIKGALNPPTKTEDGEFVHIDSVRFSPDGKELALFSSGQRSAVLAVHDLATGNINVQHDLPASFKSLAQNSASYKGPTVDFTAEPVGFLLYGGVLIDREHGMILWNYRQGILEFSHWRRMLTPSGFIASTGGNRSRKIVSMPFPGKAVQDSLEALRTDQPALVKPGEKVRVDITVGEVRFGKPADAKTALEAVIAERLADDGIEVAEDGATIMRVVYKEKAGKNLQEFKGGTIRGGGTPTGKTIASTAAEMKIVWTSKDNKLKIYEDVINFDPSTLLVRNNEEITDEVAREKVFGMLKYHLAGLPIPYFVPEDKALAQLPVKTLSAAAAGKSKDDSVKSKLEKNKNKFKK